MLRAAFRYHSLLSYVAAFDLYARLMLTFLSFVCFLALNWMQDDFPAVPEAQLGALLHVMSAKLLQDHSCELTHRKNSGGRGTLEINGWPSQIADAQTYCYQMLMGAIARPDAKKYPPTWGPGPHKYEIKSVEVMAGTPEYADVLKQLRATISNASLIKLERIQRPNLYVDTCFLISVVLASILFVVSCSLTNAGMMSSQRN